MDPIQPLIIRYMNLAHSITDHLPNYIDTYFGPKEWILPAAERQGESLTSLKGKCEALLDEFRAVEGIEPRRMTFLEAQLQAMQMTFRILEGEEIPLEQKVERLFGIVPQKFPDSDILAVHNHLDGLLPGTGALRERMDELRQQTIIPGDKLETVFESIIPDLQRWTKELYTLPSHERYQLEFVTDKP